MANRFERGIIYDAPLQWHQQELYKPDFKMWAGALAQQQKQYDTTNSALRALRPDALEKHSKEANAYHQKWVDKSDTLAKTFANQGVAAGNRLLNQTLSEVQDEVTNPNSEYNAFKTVKTQYMTELDRLKKFHEKDPIKDNLGHSLEQLNSQVKEWGNFYDSENKNFIKGISDVTATPYMDMTKDLLEYSKFIQIDGESIQYTNGRWMTTESNKEVPQSRINEAFRGFIEDPKYSGQLDVATWAKASNYTPETYQTAVNDNINSNLKRIKKGKERINDLISSKDPEKVREGQRLLQAEGYNIKEDGDPGKNTLAALERYNTRLDRMSQQQKDKTLKDLDEKGMKDHLRSGIEKTYEERFNSLFGREYSKKLNADPYGVAAANHSYKIKEIDHEFALQNGLYSSPSDPGDVGTSRPISNVKLEEFTKTANEALQSSNNAIKAEANNEVLKEALGGVVLSEDELGTIFKAYATGGNLNEAISGLGLDGYDVGKVQEYLNSGKGETLRANFKNKLDAERKIDQLNQYQTEVTEEYRKEIGADAWKNFKESSPLLQDKTEEEAKKVIEDLNTYRELTKRKNELTKQVTRNPSLSNYIDVIDARLEKMDLNKMYHFDKEYRDYKNNETSTIEQAKRDGAFKSKRVFTYINHEDGKKGTPKGIALTKRKETYNKTGGDGFDITWINAETGKPIQIDNAAVKVTGTTDVKGLTPQEGWFGETEYKGQKIKVQGVSEVDPLRRQSDIKDTRAELIGVLGSNPTSTSVEYLADRLYNLQNDEEQMIDGLNKNEKLNESNSGSRDLVVGNNVDNTTISRRYNVSKEAYETYQYDVKDPDNPDRTVPMRFKIHGTGYGDDKKYITIWETTNPITGAPMERAVTFNPETRQLELDLDDSSQYLKPSLEGAKKDMYIFDALVDPNVMTDLRMINEKEANFQRKNGGNVIQTQ